MPDLATALKNAINNINTNKEIKVKDQAQVTHNELDNVIKSWGEDTTADVGQHKANKHVFQPTNNVSRATFGYVKANPGIKYRQLINLAQAQGYKATSAGSILTQLVRVGMVRREEDGSMYVTQSEYTPVKYKVLRKEQRKAVRQAKSTKKQTSAKPAKPATRPYVKSGKYSKKAAEGIAALGAQANGTITLMEQKTPIVTPIGNDFNADQLLSTLSFTQAIALYKKLKAMLGEV